MKRSLFYFVVIFLITINKINSQCVALCGTYSLSTINYTTFPASGTIVPLGDDDTTAFIPLGFNFNFYCTTYNSVKICSNGFITFDHTPFSTASTPYAQSLPSTVLPNAVIAYNWNDLDPGAGGTISYMITGTSPNQQFIITYSAVPLWSITPQVLNTGQIILSESDNSIEVHIGSAGNNGWLTLTEGIENASASAAVAVPGRNLALWTATNSAHRWEKITTPSPPTNLGGNNMICYGTQESYTCDPMPGANSYNWALPNGWVGSSTSSTINTTIGFSGVLAVSASYSCGTSATSTILITTIPAPNITVVSYSPSVLCAGASANITLSGASTYTLYPGGTSGQSPLIALPLATSTFSIYGTDLNGCTSVVPANILITVNPSPTISVSSGSVCAGQPFNLSPSGAFSYTYSFNSPFPIVTPTVIGPSTYFVIGSNIYGCTGTATSNVLVKPAPNVLASASRTNICENETTTLTATGANSYTWINNGSNASITVTMSSSGIFTVTGTNTEGCYANRTVTINVNPCLGFAKLSDDKPFLLYPNPSDGAFTLHLSASTTILIYDINGKQVYKNDFASEGDFKIEVAYLVPGKYFVKAVTDSGTRSSVWLRE